MAIPLPSYWPFLCSTPLAAIRSVSKHSIPSIAFSRDFSLSLSPWIAFSFYLINNKKRTHVFPFSVHVCMGVWVSNTKQSAPLQRRTAHSDTPRERIYGALALALLYPALSANHALPRERGRNGRNRRTPAVAVNRFRRETQLQQILRPGRVERCEFSNFTCVIGKLSSSTDVSERSRVRTGFSFFPFSRCAVYVCFVVRDFAFSLQCSWKAIIWRAVWNTVSVAGW